MADFKLILIFQDVDECVQDNPCSDNAICTNTVGSVTCECKKGFEGDGFTCKAEVTATMRFFKSTDRGVTWRRILTSAKLAITIARLSAASAGTNRAATGACASTVLRATAGSVRTSMNVKKMMFVTSELSASTNLEDTDARKGPRKILDSYFYDNDESIDP